MRSRLSRRDVEDFAAAVDGRATAGRHGPAYDRIQEFVDVAEFVRESSGPTARRDFVADLRAELMTAAVDELKPAPTGSRRERATRETARLRRRLTAAASTFVVVGGSFGLVAASAQAVPGDMLYPVKRATERVELMIRDGSGEGRALLAHATNRLEEVEALIAEGGHSVDLISGTLADFITEANAGGALLLEAYRDGGATDDIEDLRAFAAESADRLEGLAGALPSSVSTEYADAARTVNGLDSNAVSACPTCGDGLPAIDVDDELMAVMAELGEPAESPARPHGPRTGPNASVRDPASLALPDLDTELPGDPQDSGGSDQTGDGTNDDATGDDGTEDGTDDGSGPLDPSDPTDDPDSPVDDVTEPVEDGTDAVGNLVKPVTDPIQELLEGTLGLH
jgi:Domain of unknown function (DUF5667)